MCRMRIKQIKACTVYEEKKVSRLTGCGAMTQKLESICRSWNGQLSVTDGNRRPTDILLVHRTRRISQPNILATAILNF